MLSSWQEVRIPPGSTLHSACAPLRPLLRGVCGRWGPGEEPALPGPPRRRPWSRSSPENRRPHRGTQARGPWPDRRLAPPMIWTNEGGREAREGNAVSGAEGRGAGTWRKREREGAGQLPRKEPSQARPRRSLRPNHFQAVRTPS